MNLTLFYLPLIPDRHFRHKGSKHRQNMLGSH